MTTQTTPAVPEVPDIDLAFRPRTYFLPAGLDVKHLAHIAGQARREIARDLLATGDDDLPPELLAELLDEVTRTAIGKLHPMFMGGEYLPPLEPDEIEIARISLASVTADQISVRARKCDNAIEYRIVDEYEDSSFRKYVCQLPTSRDPLTLQALVAMIDGSCEDDDPVFTWLKHNIVNGGCDPAEMYDFVSVSSELYPDLGSYYRYRLEMYLDELCRESVVRPEPRE